MVKVALCLVPESWASDECASVAPQGQVCFSGLSLTEQRPRRAISGQGCVGDKRASSFSSHHVMVAPSGLGL